MKIAYFTDTFYPEINGVANTLSKLNEYLNREEIPHIFFAPEYDSEETVDNILRFKGIHIPFSPESRLGLPFYHFVRKKIEEFKPDLIHVVTEFTIGSVGVRVARDLGIPLVTSYHTNIEQYLEYFHAEFLEKSVRTYFRNFHSHAERTFCPSNQTYEQLKKQGYVNLDIWSRGVDISLYSPQKRTGNWRKQFGSDKFLCLYTGRLSYEKGLDVYLDAIRKINEKYQDRVLFLFAGDGPFFNDIKESGIENVVLTGFVRGEMLAELYADSDLFVFPSGTETFGNVLLEAMASGCPCICTDSGGVTDFTTHNENAYVVPYRNADALSAAVETLIENETLRKQLSAGALKKAKSRSWDGVMEYLISGYGDVLGKENIKSA